ncbi:MAG: hypothetical protein QOI03_2451 [Solirubrobacteraceae bacterium]|jgi:hypothetical protein|nr:hypothetical protein [Solirubrobacteraceae bacterium]
MRGDFVARSAPCWAVFAQRASEIAAILVRWPYPADLGDINLERLIAKGDPC